MPLKINEIFESIQGEGSHAGRACFFVRLQGCSVGCHFCDEKKTWRQDQGALLSEDAILARLRELNPDLRYVTISGGEPCEQDLTKLLELLTSQGYSIAIETSGTGDYSNGLLRFARNDSTKASNDFWITLSPKEIYSSKRISNEIWQAASEIKFVISGLESAKYLDEVILAQAGSKPVFIVPDWFNIKPNRDLALELCRKSAGRVKLGVQMHKYLEIA